MFFMYPISARIAFVQSRPFRLTFFTSGFILILGVGFFAEGYKPRLLKMRRANV